MFTVYSSFKTTAILILLSMFMTASSRVTNKEHLGHFVLGPVSYYSVLYNSQATLLMVDTISIHSIISDASELKFLGGMYFNRGLLQKLKIP